MTDGRERLSNTTAGLLLILSAPVVIPALVVLVPARWAYRRWLRMQWERTWGREGKRILLVYSRSPHWRAHIETTWLPRTAPYAVVVDWSERSTWPRRAPIEIRVFRHWGGRRQFNPLAVLFRNDGTVDTIRFFQAFRDSRHGKEDALRTAEAELFAFVEGLRANAA